MALHIRDIKSMTSDQVIVLSTGDTTRRLSLIDMSGTAPIINAEAAFTNPATAIIPAGNTITALTRQSGSPALTRFSLSDLDLTTRVCDIVANCTTIDNASTSSSVMRTVRTQTASAWNRIIPMQSDSDNFAWSSSIALTNSVALLNLQSSYTTTPLDLLVRADSPVGIQQLALLIDGAEVMTRTVSALTSLEHTFAAVPLTPGFHT
ncbi:MAG: hypothetical protein ACK46D_01725, partial [Roseiflexaceae bacterium]